MVRLARLRHPRAASGAGGLEAQEARYFWLFISPWIIGFLAFQGGPILASLFFSFTDWNLFGDIRLIGLDNYSRLFTLDDVFRASLINTAYYSFGHIFPAVAFAFAAALLLNRGIKGLPLFRTVYYMPAIVPAVSSAVIWKWVFHPDFGLLNSFLQILGLPKVPWLGSTEWAMPALIIMSWWGFGVSMVILLAGLQGVPEHLLEAARIDGAGPWDEFRHVVVPMVSPVIFFVMIIQVIGSFQVFTPSYIMTDGGPGTATLTLVLYLYRNGFNYLKMGYASAIAWVLFAIVLALTLLQLRLGRSWVYYEGDIKALGGKQ